MKGILIGLLTFIIIGVFHPIVIKNEYHFGVKVWPVFAIFGIIFVGLAFYINEIFWSAILSVIGFTCFWSILEVFEQRQRVEKGWFPRNPKRKDDEN